jgi:hypothetical protein
MIHRKMTNQNHQMDEDGHDMGIDMKDSLEMSEEEFRY